MVAIRTTQILARLSAWRVPPEHLCGQLLGSCVEDLPVTGASLVVMNRHGAPGVVSVTDTVAEMIEELQFTLGEGPGVDCFRTGWPVLHGDVAETGPQRWSGFAPAALGAGIGAVFALPLQVGVQQLGVLDLYRDEPGPLCERDLIEARHYADAATSVLLHLQALAERDADSMVSRSLWWERAEIDQATGFVAAQAGVAMVDALALLRARAFADNRPVLAVAGAVLRREVQLGDRS